MFFLFAMVAAFIGASIILNSNFNSYHHSYSSSQYEPYYEDRVVDLPIEELKSMIIQNLRDQSTDFQAIIKVNKIFNLLISEITVTNVYFKDIYYNDFDIDVILNPKYNEVIIKGTIQSIQAILNVEIKNYFYETKNENFSFKVEGIQLEASFSLQMNYLKFNNDRLTELKFTNISVNKKQENSAYFSRLSETWSDYLLETFKDSIQQSLIEIHSHFIDLSLLKIQIFPDNQLIQSTQITNEKTFRIKARIREDQMLKLI